jgi:hypothetical protein
MNHKTVPGAVALAALLWLSGSVAANADTADVCDRKCLTGLMDTYLAALAAHDPSRLPLAPNARYTENTNRMPLGDGFWQTIERIEPSRLYIADPATSQVAYYGAATENGHGVLFGVRLKHAARKLSEIECFVVRRGPAIFGAFDDMPQPEEIWSLPLAPSERVSREAMIHAANQYFEGIEQGNGEIVPLENDAVTRVENGVQTAPSKATAARPAMGIRESFSSKRFTYITAVTQRRFLLVDEERGIVYGTFMFQHPGSVRTADFEEAKKNPNSVLVYPNTTQIIESFRIRNGKISRIFAHIVLLPYRQDPGWPTP